MCLKSEVTDLGGEFGEANDASPCVEQSKLSFS